MDYSKSDSPEHGIEGGSGRSSAPQAPPAEVLLSNALSPEVPVAGGGCDGFVRWDPTLQTYAARIDVLGWMQRRGSPWPAIDLAPGTAWGWLSGEDRSTPPVAEFGHRLGQYLTIDALRNAMVGRGMAPSADSWDRMLGLRDFVDRCVGPAVITVSERGDVQRGTTSNSFSLVRQQDRRMCLDICMPNRASFAVPPMFIDANWAQNRTGIGRSVLDVAGRILELVWGRSQWDDETIAWELAYEVLDTQLPFSLVAASIADWIAHGSGLQWIDTAAVQRSTGDVAAPFRQLSLAI